MKERENLSSVISLVGTATLAVPDILSLTEFIHKNINIHNTKSKSIDSPESIVSQNVDFIFFRINLVKLKRC
jgi:hypothetical protein